MLKLKLSLLPNLCRGIGDRYGLIIDQVSGQDGWILVKLYFREFMDRDGVEVHKLAKKKKKNKANIQLF